MLLARNLCGCLSFGWSWVVESMSRPFSTAAKCCLFVNTLWLVCGFQAKASAGSNPALGM